MKLDNVLQIIRAEAKNRGYALEVRDSASTNSVYCTLTGGVDNVEIIFRVADHRGNKGELTTLRLDYRLNDKLVRAFVKNRIQELQRKSLYNVLFAK